MNKKMTLKEAGERADAFSGIRAKEIIDTADIELSEKPNISFQFRKNGKSMEHFYCPACGHEWEDERSMYRISNSCPNCKRTSMYNPTSIRFNNDARNMYILDRCKSYVVILEMDIERGYILFGEFNPKFSYVRDNSLDMQECLDRNSFEFLKGRWEFDKSHVNSIIKFVFLADKGLRVLRNGKLTNSNSDYVQSLERRLRNAMLVGKDAENLNAFLDFYSIPKRFDILESIAREHSLIMNEIARAPKRERKTKEKVSKFYEDYVPKKIPEHVVKSVEQEMSGLFLLKDEIGSRLTYNVLCPVCGTVSKVNGLIHGYDVEVETAICPTCGKRIPYVSRRTSSDSVSESQCFLYFETMEDTGYFVQREFVVDKTFSIDGTSSTKLDETDRIFYTDKKPVHLEKARGDSEWVIKTNSSRYYNAVSIDTVPQTKDEIYNLIKSSVLKYSGLCAAWGLDRENPVEKIGTRGPSSYINVWYSAPYIEKLILADMYALTNEAKRCGGLRNIKADEKNLVKILNVEQPVFDIARKRNFSSDKLRLCQRLWEIDHTLNDEKYGDIEALDCNMSIIISVAENFGISLSAIKDYLDDCYGYQCIQRQEALNIWRDYLNMAKSLKYNLKDKSKKFPSSLKKEHDKAVFSYNAIKQELIREEFSERVKENKKYEYKGKDFIVRIPEEPEDIVSEGRNLHHCVASYVNSVREGNTVIAFIRRKEAPDDSFFTMEILRDYIHQVKGSSNIKPVEENLCEFIREFADKKGLKIAGGIF